MNDILAFVGTTLTTLVAAFITWFFTRKKARQEVKSSEIDNQLKTAEYYQKILDDFDKRLKLALTDLDRATNSIRERDIQIDELTKELRARDKKIDDLMTKIDTLLVELKKYKQLNGKSDEHG
jgi:peptidoglycan hydrolase CwlO-like protein